MSKPGNGPGLMKYAAAQIAAGVIFGFSYLFMTKALPAASPLVILSWRFLLAAAILAVLYFLERRRQPAPRQHRPVWPVLLLGLFEPVLYFLLESYALMHTTTTFSSVMLATVPILSVLLGVVILHEKPRVLQVLGIVVSVIGVILVSLENMSFGVVEFRWILVLLAAMASSAMFVVLSRKLSAGYSPLERTFGMFVTAAAVFCAMALWENRETPQLLWQPLSQPQFAAAILYLGGLSSVLAFLLVNYANTALPVAVTCALGNITPVVSLLAGVILLRESFGTRSLVGMALILVGVAGAQYTSGHG